MSTSHLTGYPMSEIVPSWGGFSSGPPLFPRRHFSINSTGMDSILWGKLCQKHDNKPSWQ